MEKDKLRINWVDKGRVLEATWRIGTAIGFHENVPENVVVETKGEEGEGRKMMIEAIENKICETAFNEIATELPMEFRNLKIRTHKTIPEGYLYVSQYDLDIFLRDRDVKMTFLEVKEKKGGE